MNPIQPDYYKNTLNQSSLIKIMNLGYFEFSLGNAIKYLYRAGKKDDFNQDVQKSLWYLENFLNNNMQRMQNLRVKFYFRNNLTIDQITAFVNDAEITPHQKEWLIDLMSYTDSQDIIESQENIKKIKGVAYSLKCYLHQQNLGI